MNIQSATVQAGRFIRKAINSHLSESETAEPEVGALWEKVTPDLEKALAVFDKQESSATPQSNWNPFADSKESCQKSLDKILDVLLVILGTCGASGYRTRIRSIQDEIQYSRHLIGQYREQMISAPLEASQNPFNGLLVSSRESIKDQIADENDRITEMTRQLESLKVGFREHLQKIGISVSKEEAESFLLPVEDDVVAMAAVISNIGRLTEQLQILVDENKEIASHTKRYYGIYVLLVFAVDRVQKHFVREVDENYIPRLDRFEKEAAQNITDAQALSSRGEHAEQLSGNIAAGRKTIDACRLMAEVLRSHRKSVIEENKKVQTLAAAAVNSYRTVRLSFNVADLIGYCEAAFKALRELRLPPLRPFQNVQLNEELQRLANRMAKKE